MTYSIIQKFDLRIKKKNSYYTLTSSFFLSSKIPYHEL